MPKSMTGFARVQVETDLQLITIEVKTVNHRYLDLQFRMPRNLTIIEDKLKTYLSPHISRGRVEVYVHIAPRGEIALSARINQQFIRTLLAQVDNLSGEFPALGPLSWDTVLQLPNVWQDAPELEEDPALCSAVLEAFQTVIGDLANARLREGQAIQLDLQSRIHELQSRLIELKNRSQALPGIALKKWQERLETLIKDIEFDPSRISAEAAMMADRMNVDEEIVRLQVHTEHFLEMIDSEGPIGRKLDFLIQEMNREINTIGSKSSDSQLSKLVVDAKSILEQCREQIQNIE